MLRLKKLSVFIVFVRTNFFLGLPSKKPGTSLLEIKGSSHAVVIVIHATAPPLLILDFLCERGGSKLLPTGCVVLKIGGEWNVESFEKEHCRDFAALTRRRHLSSSRENGD